MTVHSKPELAEGLVRGGVFRASWMNDLGYDAEAVHGMCVNLFGQAPTAFSSDWFAVLSDDTVAGDAVLRIAGALYDELIPFSDMSEAVIKMIRYGITERQGAINAKLGIALAEHFSVPVPADVIIALAEFIGGTCRDGRCDFGDAARASEPVLENEIDMLAMLTVRMEGHAPVSWLSRRLKSRPSRSKLYYKVVPSIPFVLKDPKGPIRLLGKTVDANALAKGTGDIFIGLKRTKDGSRVRLDYRVTEEAVESNSFNVRPEWRDFVHGEFIEVNTGVSIRYNRYGKDARKLAGVGLAIRKAYPEYENGENAVIFLDHTTGLATVEVGHATPKFEDRIADFMSADIIPRSKRTPLPRAA